MLCVCVGPCVKLFFFSQKTAYVLRISDWSSAVCSADLSCRQQPGTPSYCTDLTSEQLRQALAAADKDEAPRTRDRLGEQFASLTEAPDRKSDVEGKREAVR